LKRRFSLKASVSVVLVTLVASISLFYLARKPRPPELLYRIRLSVPGFQSSALVLLAESRGYFRSEGIETSMVFRDTGRDCLDMVVNGKSDLAVVFETPVTHSLLAGNKISVLTEIHRSEKNTAVVVRRDRGINTAGDLVGKTIATIPKTNAEFLLDLYLRSHLVNPKSVNIVERQVDQAVKQVAAGQVDGAALWQPYVSQSMSANPEQFQLLQSSYYSEYSLLAGLRENIDSQQKSIYAVMKALLKARDYFQANKVEAQEQVDKLLSERGFFVSKEAWNQMEIHLGLSATLLTMLNEESKWYSSHQKPSRSINYDVKSVLRGRYLSLLAPELVTYE
jgi:ABC-type nitrate/sulfonate/bicarbonate transport system substrate-binding protein